DQPGVVKDRRSYSARGAGILGLAQFGHRPFYALRDDLSLDVAGLLAYLESARDRTVLLFGFTWMVWQYFVIALDHLDVRPDLSRAILVHSGGWKRLEELAVTPERFR